MVAAPHRHRQQKRIRVRVRQECKHGVSGGMWASPGVMYLRCSRPSRPGLSGFPWAEIWACCQWCYRIGRAKTPSPCDLSTQRSHTAGRADLSFPLSLLLLGPPSFTYWGKRWKKGSDCLETRFGKRRNGLKRICWRLWTGLLENLPLLTKRGNVSG